MGCEYTAHSPAIPPINSNAMLQNLTDVKLNFCVLHNPLLMKSKRPINLKPDVSGPLSICHTGASDMEKAVMKVVFSNYNLKVRPAVSPEERVVVRVGMVLSSFVGLVRHKTQTIAYIHTYAFTANSASRTE